MNRVAIVGIGDSKFGIRTDASARELSFEAAKEAFDDARLTPKDIDYSVIGITSAEMVQGQGTPASIISNYLGLIPQGSMRVEAACATGSAAIRTAYGLIASGISSVVLVLGVEKMNEAPVSVVTEAIGRSSDLLWEFNPCGVTFPGFYALMARSHMDQYGTTEEDMARVAVKNHHYGALNPKAHLQKEITIDQVLNSRPIARPLKLYDCSLITDGASAVIMASGDVARKITDTPVWIRGMGCASGPSYFSAKESYTSISAAAEASRQCYRMAKMEPKDINVALVHDCFTIAEIIAYEDLGFCKEGDGAKLIKEEQTHIGGKIPVNVDGGLKAKGHPIGATGVSMTIEATRQLRGEGGKRQVPKAEVALTHNVGQTGQYCYVHMYTR